MSKTTIIAILVFVGAIVKLATDLLSGNPVEFNSIWISIITLLSALGFKLAADQK